MARQTDTRAEVRRVAQELSRAGQTPTPTLVRQLLGQGSMNTIVDELRKWREAQGVSQERTPSSLSAVPPTLPPAAQEPLKLVSLGEVVDLLNSVRALAEQQLQTSAKLAEKLSAREQQDLQIQEVLQSTLAALSTQEARHAAQLAAVSDSMEKLASRFDGVQRHMLLQIAEAREQATTWKEKHLASKKDFAVWRDTLQAQVLRLTEELAWSRGSAGKPLPRSSPASPGVTRPVTDRPRLTGGLPSGKLEPSTSYPGHPRASPLWDEHQE